MPEVARQSHKTIAHRLLPLLLLLAAAVAAQQYVARNLQPVNPTAAETVTVEIAAGASTREVAELLYRHHLIHDPAFFRFYARFRDLDSLLKPGEYQLTQAMTPTEILGRLAQGEVVAHRFTIPEGLTVVQIADLLAAEGIVDREEFLEAAASSQLTAQYLPEGVDLAQPLEGYLFPDTYEYQRDATAAELLAMMVRRFEQVWTPELQSRAEELNLTVHQAITLASIVEEEAQTADERPRISGVYHNRNRIGMKLDADPTVRYAVAKPPGEELSLQDLAVESPYNTYRQSGLPPGPIASPGEASIRAALYPEEHDFWYFVARGDGSGRHYFAETLSEQERNIELYRANSASQ